MKFNVSLADSPRATLGASLILNEVKISIMYFIIVNMITFLHIGNKK